MPDAGTDRAEIFPFCRRPISRAQPRPDVSRTPSPPARRYFFTCPETSLVISNMLT